MTVSATSSAKPAEKPKKPGFVDRWYHARVWDGFLFTAWMRLFFRNRLHVGWHRIGMAIVVTIASLVNSSLRLAQWLIYGRRIARTEVKEPPVFILGHWRSGTTMLHDMLALDDRNVCPSTYQCFVPGHFLISEWLFTRVFAFTMPKQRPMDNMKLGWQRPQEDEFALQCLGVPSPYWTFAFPNHPPQAQEYLDMQGVPPAAVKKWQATLRHFVKMLVCHRPGRPVLKSPPHTGRAKCLLEAFPGAKIVHIVRDPRVVFQSTLHMWNKMYVTQGFQHPKYQGLEEHVFNTFVRMYDAFEAQRHLIPPENYFEVRYEDLVADPMGQMRAMYEHLKLGDFECVRPAFENYLREQGDYQTNRYDMPEELRAEINRRWAKFVEKYGY